MSAALLGVVVVMPFFFSMTGVKVFQFGSIGGGAGGGAGEGLLMSTDGGERWDNAAVSEDDRVAPFPKGVFDLVFHPQDPDIIFLGSDDSGLWVSKNGGKSWKKIFDKRKVLDQKADVFKIAVSRSDPNVIYLAVFQNNRGRVLKSIDGGEIFREVYFVSANRYGVFDIYVNSVNPERVIIATGQGGILESLNGGATWRVVKWFTEAVARLTVNPRSSNEIYIVTSGGNLWRSLDSGENWGDLPEGLSSAAAPYPPTGVINPFNIFSGRRALEEFIMDPERLDTFYIGSQQGLLRSESGGNTWERLNVLIPPDALPVDAVAIHPENSNLIFAAASNQLYKSEDNGINWSVDILPTKSRIKTLVIHPLRPNIMFAVLGR